MQAQTHHRRFETRGQLATLLAVLAWALGSLVLPAVHLRHHRSDHVHLPNGAIAFGPAEQNRAPVPADPRRDAPPAGRAPAPFDHGTHALAHLGGLYLPAPATMLTTLARPVENLDRPSTPRSHCSSSPHLKSLGARAPPPARLLPEQAAQLAA